MTTTLPTFSHAPAAKAGECPVCGHLADLRTDGRIKTHNERRIRRGQTARGDLHPQTYDSGTRCDGTGQRPARNDD